MKTEGKNAVLELIKSGKTIDKIVLEKDSTSATGRIFAEARRRDIRVQFVDAKSLDKMSETGKHQGAIAFSTDFVYSELQELIDEKKGSSGFIVLCDGIEDVHNLGSIIRVCECAGADGIVITKANSAQVNETVMRISAGAANHVKVAKVASINGAIDVLKKLNYWVFGLEAEGESIYSQDFNCNVALVIGGEDSGVKRLTRTKCDKLLSLPLYGKVNSLNASVALGIAAYEVIRYRNGQK